MIAMTTITNDTTSKKKQLAINDNDDGGEKPQMSPVISATTTVGKMVLDDGGSSVIYHPSLWSKLTRRTLFFFLIPAIPVMFLFLFFMLLIDQGVLFGPPPKPVAHHHHHPKPVVVHRLPLTLFPSLYVLDLQVFLPYKPGVDFGPQNLTIWGRAIINFECREDTDEIYLHSNGLVLQNDSIKLGHQDNHTNMHIHIEYVDPITHILAFRTEPMMLKGNNYSILIHYGTRIGAAIDGGLFLAEYEYNGEKRYHAVSQMQSIESRRLFPCFDEPAFKARFQINVVHPTGTRALSNAEAVDVLQYKSNWTKTTFDESPRMSTYIVALTIGDFEHIEAKYNNVKVRMWSPPQFLNDTQYSLDIFVKGLSYYERYFNISYPLPKLDIYVVKELRVAAMENWGLITTRDTSILCHTRYCSNSDLMKVSMVTLHELAHSWFGNLITMQWWNDLWLNEGFAVHMSYKAMKSISPEFDMNIIDYNTLAIFKPDTMHELTPLSFNVTTRDQIQTAFGKVVYDKGAALLNMIEETVGENIYQISLRSFIKHHLYDNAISEDFAKSIERTVTEIKHYNPFEKLGIVESVKTWTKKTGLPLIVVKRLNDTSYEIRQEAYNLGPNVNVTANYRYSVPIFYTTDNDWSGKKRKTVVINGNDTVIVNNLVFLNPFAKGYYLVQYDTQTWKKIIHQFRTDHLSIPSRSRTRLIFETFHLASVQRLNITMVLDLVKYIKNETNAAPITLFIITMEAYERIFVKEETAAMFKKFYIEMLIPIFERIASNIQVDEDCVYHSSKRSVIKTVCGLGYQPCIDYARYWFSKIKESCKNLKLSDDCNKINPTYRTSIYTSVLKYGTKEDFEFLWEKYLIEDKIVEKEKIYQGLAGSPDSEMIKRIFDYQMTQPKPNYATCIYYFQANNLPALGKYLINHLQPLIPKGHMALLCLQGLFRIPQTAENRQILTHIEEKFSKDFPPPFKPHLEKYKRINQLDTAFEKVFDQTLATHLHEYFSNEM